MRNSSTQYMPVLSCCQCGCNVTTAENNNSLINQTKSSSHLIISLWLYSELIVFVVCHQSWNESRLVNTEYYRFMVTCLQKLLSGLQKWVFLGLLHITANNRQHNLWTCLFYALYYTPPLDNSHVQCLLLDFSKASDVVEQEIVINKLKALRLPPFLLHWIISVLRKCSEICKVGDELLFVRGIMTGWPQFWRKKIQGVFKDFSRTFNQLFQTHSGDVLPSYLMMEVLDII